jgi:phage/plasmid-like protein (TIGR03299 family)
MTDITFDSQIAHRYNTVQEKPWLSPDQPVGNYYDSLTVLKAAGLDFEVKKYNNTCAIPGGPTTLSQQKYFTYRSDNFQILGEGIGTRYTIVQNRDAFKFFDTIVPQAGIIYETAGCVRNGEEIFITAKLPDYIKVGGNEDVCEKYIFLYNSHDGKGCLIVGITPVRIWCNNMLNSVISTCKNKIKIRHTDGIQDKLNKAHEFLKLSAEFSDYFAQMMNQWAKKPILDRSVRKLIEYAIASKETIELLRVGNRDELPTQFVNTVNGILEYNDLHPSQKLLTTRGTLYGVYNAVTGYFQNVKEFDSWEHKFTSIAEGGTTFLKTQACFELCQQYFEFGDIALQ